MLSLPATEEKRLPAMRVVGVAGDVRFVSIFDDAPPVAYLPAAQHPGESHLFVVRGRDGGDVPDATIRRIGTATDARVPMSTTSITGEIDEQLGPQRVASAWIGVFGMIALLLAAIGLYGVVAQGVLHRTRELAVRSALGATPRGLVSLVIGDGMRIAGVGAVVGVLAGAAALRMLQSQFDGVSVGDARAAAVAVGVVCVAMVGACWVPARMAGRMNPAEALRSD
jgi:predicted lysophospholipase L1 biosynthesis ABC-type transport system permease subunit